MSRSIDLEFLSSLPVRRSLIRGRDRRPHMERLVLDNNTFLNIIYQDDGWEDPHSHPWDFKSTILSGCYEQKRYREDGVLFDTWVFSEGDENELKAEHYHTLKIIKAPVVTLMTVGVRRLQAYVLTDKGRVKLEEYVRR